jgi:hypothetical protein
MNFSLELGWVRHAATTNNNNTGVFEDVLIITF